jgi:hypothetical protein
LTDRITIGRTEYKLVEEPTVGLVEKIQLALVAENKSTVGRLINVINLGLAAEERPIGAETPAKFDELMSAWRAVLRNVGFKEVASQGEGAAPAAPTGA